MCWTLCGGEKPLIPVFFEKEAINTLDAKGEVLLTIMASLAQQERQSLSQNVRLGLQYRYQQSKVQVCTNRFLGYDKDEDGNLVINPEEAEVVKRIYREYLEGNSYYAIGQGLTADGTGTFSSVPPSGRHRPGTGLRQLPVPSALYIWYITVLPDG